MPEKRIGPAPGEDDPVCLDPEHEPAKHIVRSPGTYEHTCPRCGRVIVFIVPHKPRYQAGKVYSGGHTPDTYL